MLKPTEYAEAVRTAVLDAGFLQVDLQMKLGIPDHLLVLVADEFDEDEPPDAPARYQASCPYYTVTTECGTFGIAWVGPEFPVLDLTGCDKPLTSLGEPLADHVYPCTHEVLQGLKLLLS